MAGDWLKFEKSTSDKPEVWAIADQLGIDPDAVVGKLLRVWAWFDEQSEEGNAPSVSKMLLDRRVGVTGFCDSMVSCGWMIDDGKEVTLPNFDRHNGKTAKNRSLTAKRVAKHKQKSNDEGNDDSVTNALPREEKRREEKNKDTPPKSPKGDAIDYSSWPEQPDPQVLKDWIASRKKAKATHSQTAINRIGTELRKAVGMGYTVNDCLSLAVVKGWRGFEAEWMRNASQPVNQPPMPAHRREMPKPDRPPRRSE